MRAFSILALLLFRVMLFAQAGCEFPDTAVSSSLKSFYAGLLDDCIFFGKLDSLNNGHITVQGQAKLNKLSEFTDHGLGHVLNRGLDAARYNLIVYLPSDDFYYPEHLSILLAAFDEHPEFFLVYSGMRYENNDSLFRSPDLETATTRRGYSLQLVQVMHRRTARRWVTRSEYVTEDIWQMFWERISEEGVFGMTGKMTCF